MLLPCKECGAEISSRAYTCPRCGFPLWAERVFKVMGPLTAVICWGFGAIMYWDVEYGHGRELNGPGPLVEPLLLVRQLAIGLIVAGVVFWVVLHLIARLIARQGLRQKGGTAAPAGPIV